MVTQMSHTAVDRHIDDWSQFPDWIGGINLESCGQSQQPISTEAGLCGDGGAGPLHLWLDVQRAEAAQPGPVQVGASTHTSLMLLLLARRLSSETFSMFQGCCRCSGQCSVLETCNSGAEKFGWVSIWRPQWLGWSTSLCLRQHNW